MRATDTITSTHDDFESRILQKVSRSFALTIPQLPPILTRPVANAYLLCRIADTIEDAADLSLGQKEKFFKQFTRVVNLDLPADRFAGQLHPLLSDHTLPAERELIQNTPVVIQTFSRLNGRQRKAIRQCVETMSHGMFEFQKLQNPYGLETLSQLNDYCYYVAGVVGDMLTMLFCDYSRQIEKKYNSLMRLAASFGQGLQMTNIIKDLWEDKSRGACWLPKDLFREAGFDLDQLRAGYFDPKFGRGLSALIGVAHGHLQNALAYTLMLPRHESGIRKFCIWAVGMAIFTLRNINSHRDYTCGQDVKISRDTSHRVIMVSNASIRSNLLLKLFFSLATRGLPLPEATVRASQPVDYRYSDNQPCESHRSMN
jgi:farnesyl-diphosphate farnesyltransferase